MVRKIYEIGVKENPKKKYRGIFDNIYPHGYNGWRLLVLKMKNSEKVLLIDCTELTKQRRENNITIGDKIKIDYRDEYNFTIKKLTEE